MPSNPRLWTRRQFAQLLAASTASTLLGQRAQATAPKGFAHIASSANAGAIHTFRVSGSNWRQIQTLESPNPAHLEPHPTLPILYAIHNVPLWHHLPRGAVSAYAIAPNGHLTLLHTQPLSLAATHPRHAAVSPDGTSLAVVCPEACIYNILPLTPDGALHPPTIIRKYLNLATTQTRQLLFLPDSKTLLTADAHHQPLDALTITEDSLLPIAIDSGPLIKPDRNTLIHQAVIAQIDSPTSILFRPA